MRETSDIQLNYPKERKPKMDIYCPRCGEPLDTFELHDQSAPFDTYDKAREAFFNPRQGCGVLFTGNPCEARDTPQGDASLALSEMLGDDVDAIASMSADF